MRATSEANPIANVEGFKIFVIFVALIDFTKTFESKPIGIGYFW
jgi:hypothetical protein